MFVRQMCVTVDALCKLCCGVLNFRVRRGRKVQANNKAVLKSVIQSLQVLTGYCGRVLQG